MSFFSAIGTALGSVIGGPVGSKIGAGVGSLIDGKMSSGGSSKAGQLDLGRLRRQADKHGFNPLTVLRYTGGAGFQRGPEAPSFFAESARHFGNALDQIHQDERQTAEVENLNALTDVYRSEVALNHMAVQATSRPVFSSTGGGGNLASSVPQARPAGVAAGGWNHPYSIPTGDLGGRPTGPRIAATNADGKERIEDSGRSGWEIFGFDMTPYPGNSDAETAEMRGAEPMSWALGAASVVMDPLYTAGAALDDKIGTSITTDEGFNQDMPVPNPVGSMVNGLGIAFDIGRGWFSSGSGSSSLPRNHPMSRGYP